MVSDGPIAIDTNGQNVTFASPLSNSNVGGLTKIGAGTLVLAASNGYYGTTTLSGGVLNLANAGAIPSRGGITFAGGTLQYTASNTVDYSSNIVNSSGPIAIDTNGQNVTFASAISISNVGGLTKLGTGMLTLAANNAYSGNTAVSGGTLQLGDGVANNGSVAGNIVNNSALVVANPASQFFTSVVSGSGSFTKTGAGTLVIASNQTYSGPTVIKTGIMQLGGGASISGFGADTVGVNGSNSTWTVNTAGNITATGITGGSLTLTDGNTGEARGAYSTTRRSRSIRHLT